MSMRDLPKAEVSAKPGIRSDVNVKALQRWNPDVRSAAEEGDASISILEVIGQDFWGDGVTAKRISGALRAIGDRDVVVNINSPGGDFFEGLAIYNALREHPAKVTVRVLGVAASAASVIAMAGDEIRIARAGFLMIHNTWVLAAGDRHALTEVAQWLEPFDAVSADIYAARSGIDAKKISAMLDRETWISGGQAVEQGFADGLLSADELDLSDADEGRASARAERKFDVLASKAGVSRSEARELLAALKGSKPGAAPASMHDAAVAAEVRNLLNFAKTI
ncbi:Clp protease ClpP [Rhodobacter sphaeroides]|jgi:Protease subunit of ATP-dependent Clp proteases|uniref:ATP-dependent Clp protease proteolytic subunit n=1 Tax=Cereibacter sphaeroides (strain ATCC 17023 / DSM 158 / JCM 6121 / CCUG 31486 / LMG 2827 / NBRC 12203 / NCIMB 8253 / ATH 2.4.1.) TaxID=272943 RepID=Q3J4R5_CERS4|nr:head maturation protease, ClpP-related [Cereibacter sphaeroides]ABA78219.1 putative ClpP-like protease [Cereibacter sphaeroides 2.4.1]AMJ46582.1 peptidase [Cereibacter sphaeroides]ANS33295.1 peptidase [Cereibacter sphaeroides]ATN62338.1 peptidase [Cereibacter sphaeroides]AXC60443.1 Clp protease ClpP [Cereibacter sphaeroides 2.4.1]